MAEWRSRRALLYMPGDDLRKIRKATTLGVDCICMDMEDGTALSRKAAARATIVEALHTLNFGAAERLARINSVGSGFEGDDLQVVLPARPDGIVIPKMESAAQLQWVSAQIAQAEQAHGWQHGSIRLLVVVESALGIVNLREICTADPRLDAVIFGAEDYAASVGAIRTPDALEVLYARSAVVAHTAAFGLQAIDLVTIEFRDLEVCARDAAFGAQLGFVGKQIIHPAQVEPVQRAFTPSADAVAYARRVVETFEAAQAQGTGAYELDGKMIDLPLLKSAQRVLARAH
ncbi:MAG: CoA ester lyase [Anaerolineales bacterium]